MYVLVDSIPSSLYFLKNDQLYIELQGTVHTVSFKYANDILLTMPKPLTLWITINCGKF